MGTIIRHTFLDSNGIRMHVTDAGRGLLTSLDPQVNAADEEVVAVLSQTQLEQFIELLDIVRGANAERGAPRTAVPASRSARR